MTPGQSSDPTEQLPRVVAPAEGASAEAERAAAADGDASGAAAGESKAGDGRMDGAVRGDRATAATADQEATGKTDSEGKKGAVDATDGGGVVAPAVSATRTADGVGRATAGAGRAGGAGGIVAGMKAKVSSLGKGSATGKTPAKATRPEPSSTSAPGRRVRLTLSRVDPWSALKMSFLLSVALGVAMVVAVTMLWLVFKGMGAFDQINRLLGSIIQDGDKKFDITDYIGLGRVVSLSVVFAVIDVFFVTALSTLAAYLYNVSSSLVGGLQLTLTDD